MSRLKTWFFLTMYLCPGEYLDDEPCVQSRCALVFPRLEKQRSAELFLLNKYGLQQKRLIHAIIDARKQITVSLGIE